jgi:hypothetical protein
MEATSASVWGSMFVQVVSHMCSHTILRLVSVWPVYVSIYREVLRKCEDADVLGMELT